MMKVYTSEEILGMDDLYKLQNEETIHYQMTAAEIGWAEFIRGHYCIADYIYENMDNDMVLCIDTYELSSVLDDDCKGAGKAVMLSDDTALQRVFFWLYDEGCNDES